jgi:hypothetical protein
VTRLTPTGGALFFSTYLGGTGNDFGYEIATRPAPGIGGSFVAAYVGGDTISSNFPTQFPYQTEPGDGGLYDSFVTKVAQGQVQTQQAVTAGGTVSTSPGPLVEASVTSPNAGNVTIVGGLSIGAPGGAIEFDITAPTATAADPLVLRFLIHGPSAPTLAAAIRNLTLVQPCTGTPGTASPDPCVASTTTLVNGDLEIIVNTSAREPVDDRRHDDDTCLSGLACIGLLPGGAIDQEPAPAPQQGGRLQGQAHLEVDEQRASRWPRLRLTLVDHRLPVLPLHAEHPARRSAHARRWHL